MPKNTSIIFNDHFADFIERQVVSGSYGSASEVVRDGLRLLEERQAKLEALRLALNEGENSGIAVDFDFRAWLDSRKRTSAKD